jgi:hypothetical protein
MKKKSKIVSELHYQVKNIKKNLYSNHKKVINDFK